MHNENSFFPGRAKYQKGNQVKWDYLKQTLLSTTSCNWRVAGLGCGQQESWCPCEGMSKGEQINDAPWAWVLGSITAHHFWEWQSPQPDVSFQISLSLALNYSLSCWPKVQYFFQRYQCITSSQLNHGFGFCVLVYDSFAPYNKYPWDRQLNVSEALNFLLWGVICFQYQKRSHCTWHHTAKIQENDWPHSAMPTLCTRTTGFSLQEKPPMQPKRVAFAQAQRAASAHFNKPVSELKAILLYTRLDLV